MQERCTYPSGQNHLTFESSHAMHVAFVHLENYLLLGQQAADRTKQL